MPDTFTAHFLVDQGGVLFSQDVQRTRITHSNAVYQLRSGHTYSRRAVGTTIKDRYALDSASDLGGYRQLLNANGSGLGTDYPGAVSVNAGQSGTAILEEWITDNGNFEGETFKVGVFSTVFRAYWTMSASTPPNHARVVLNLYRYNADGSQVLLQTMTQDITETSTKYTVNLTPLDVKWSTGDRLAVKWSCYFDLII